jgi:hypothetical protein
MIRRQRHSRSRIINRFGEMTPMNTEGRAAAAEIGARYYRNITALFASDVTPTSAALDFAKAMGFKLIITIRANSDGSPATDLGAYADYIEAVIQKWSPWGIVIENEENLSSMYSGTTTQYAAQLAAACAVTSAYDVKCMNGGISSKGLLLLIWQNVYGGWPDHPAADAFAAEAFSHAESDVLVATGPTAPIQALIDRTEAFYNLYSASNINSANFHFYVEATETATNYTVFDEAAAFMRVIGKPILNNEWGLRVDNSTVLESLMAKIRQERIPVAIYFTPDPASGFDVIELQNTDGSLTDLGTHFRDYLKL